MKVTQDQRVSNLVREGHLGWPKGGACTYLLDDFIEDMSARDLTS